MVVPICCVPPGPNCTCTRFAEVSQNWFTSLLVYKIIFARESVPRARVGATDSGTMLSRGILEQTLIARPKSTGFETVFHHDGIYQFAATMYRLFVVGQNRT